MISEYFDFSSWCEDCIENPDCGFCYTEIGKSVLNGSCVTVATNLTDGAGQGRCDSDPLTPGTVWAHGYCPTDYSWMGLLGLVMYLMFFAPGTTYLWSIPACNFSFQSFLQRAEFTSCACHAPIYPYFLLHLCCNFIRLTESI